VKLIFFGVREKNVCMEKQPPHKVGASFPFFNEGEKRGETPADLPLLYVLLFLLCC